MRLLLKITKWAALTVAVLVAVVGLRLRWNTYRAMRGRCPLSAWLRPLPHAPIQPGDSFSIEYGSAWTEPRQVTVFADGRVKRETEFKDPEGKRYGCPLHDEDTWRRIPAETATRLIAQARDGGFCRLCAFYRPEGRVYDAGGGSITLDTGGSSKTVSYYSVRPPAGWASRLITQLEDDMFAATPPFPDYADYSKRSAEERRRCDEIESREAGSSNE